MAKAAGLWTPLMFKKGTENSDGHKTTCKATFLSVKIPIKWVQVPGLKLRLLNSVVSLLRRGLLFESQFERSRFGRQ